jgi:hypothetical protein
MFEYFFNTQQINDLYINLVELSLIAV